MHKNINNMPFFHGHAKPSLKCFCINGLLNWYYWRSKDECYINGSGSGRTEGENQHCLCYKKTSSVGIATVARLCVAVEGRLASGRWLGRYSQVSVTDH